MRRSPRYADRRFYRWHIDAALYDLNPPRVTTLYALHAPAGALQTVRYDDGSNDELAVPLGTTAFVSGAQMFDRLSPAEKSLAVRTRVKYAPHPYVWMAPAKSNSLGLGLVSEGSEMPLEDLPPVDPAKVKTLPMLWKNPQTGRLHFQVHPSAVQELSIDALPDDKIKADSLHPHGAHIANLEHVRKLVYDLQRPAIDPKHVYAHNWSNNDFCLFHNQGVLHSVVGAFAPDQVRIFHQCNLAASESPLPPTAHDVRAYT